MSENPVCSIIIPLFNQVNYTRECLEAIQKNTRVSYEVIFVNNGSSDGTNAFLEEKKAAHSNIKVINLEKNIGYSGANNIGAKEASGKYLVLLNNDTAPKLYWLQELLAVMQRPNVGITGPKLLYPESDLVNHIGYVYSKKYKTFFPRYHYAASTLPLVNKERELQALLGACLCIEKTLFMEAGGLAEHGLEDIDLCLKVRKLGKKVIYCPKSVVLHHGSVTIRLSESGTIPVMNAEEFNKRWPPEVLEDDYVSHYLNDGLGIDRFNNTPAELLVAFFRTESYARMADGVRKKKAGETEKALELLKESFYIYRYNRDTAIELSIFYLELGRVNEALNVIDDFLFHSGSDAEIDALRQTILDVPLK
jgi:GT2 family glycosyltransferase